MLVNKTNLHIISHSMHPKSSLNPRWHFQSQDYACNSNRPFYPSSLPFSLWRQIISHSLSAWQGKCSNQTLLWTIIAHNNRGFWWLYQNMHWKVPFQKTNKLFCFNARLWDIYTLRRIEAERQNGGTTLLCLQWHTILWFIICYV